MYPELLAEHADDLAPHAGGLLIGPRMLKIVPDGDLRRGRWRISSRRGTWGEHEK